MWKRVGGKRWILGRVPRKNGLTCEELAEAGSERIEPDAFRWKGVRMGFVEFSAPLRDADANPVGGLVTGTRETRILDEGL